ncbi:MAG: hypothetical protein A2306_07460 [Omnitrophica WOR_2 bacterium RIFOXYB2_FULL_38_16]|nr:MAG: hypothetical protein A2267_10610 [Omnitrophica WOR_2 bacterium RIFOXYA12_FULL_38_10]OGX55060.1 MAG: hypothetical protein A2447_03605 [Omnitrophica WOR_2 bacterium RIFOXYC2_FULL_38_12]OGX57551.1 MAG: hypothetical protein A2306_07460 [Omnitrophica WOR_2 bacterium RIFOXYB2_FULL_38_16]HBG61937.1 hypothetical protein [Candidatus Omnitrophota bacterium]
MSYKDFMNRVRYWDNRTSKWMMKHFYFMFFQGVLLVVFVIWFINTINTIDTNTKAVSSSVLEQLLINQSVSMLIIVLLMLLNSFWLLYTFNSIQRLSNLLKDISYSINKLRYQSKQP